MIFHITWKESSDKLYSTGANFEGETVKDAVDLYEKLFPNKSFFSMAVQEEKPFIFHTKNDLK